MEKWRTETEGSHGVAKGGTRKEEEPLRGNTNVIQSTQSVSTKQRRIAELARQKPSEALTSLHHHIDIEWLVEAWQRTRKDGASGIDGQTAKEYAVNLRDNLADLLGRVRSGSYYAPPVRRVEIPKGDGKSTRPIGIPTIEDKVMQRAVVMLLEPIYEAEFKDFSFGFRPGKSAHDAIDYLWKQSMGRWGESQVKWILDVDISAFFDTLDHGQLRQILDQRIRDGVVRRMIDKWLKAGVMDKGQLSYRDEGTPQGGVISPLLSNIYLHEVLDQWFESEVQPRMKGRTFLVRYADDFVIGFEHEEDARRVQEVLPKRFERYGLKLHPEKTRLVAFAPPQSVRKDKEPPKQSGPGSGGSFDFLGFTHRWKKSKKGTPVMQHGTSSKRLTRALKSLRQWLAENLHEPILEQWKTLRSKVQGHYNYYGVRGNSRALQGYSHQAQREWFRSLNRRGGAKALTWERFRNWLREIMPWPEPRVRSP
jgi:RNA-directed DNA polymerase